MFIDTANRDEIKMTKEFGIMKGITTNPTILLKEKKPRVQQIVDLLVVSEGLLFVQTIGYLSEEIIKDAVLIIQSDVDNRIAIKIPVNSEGLKAIKQLREEYPKLLILGTAVYSVDQGILAGLAGCDYVAPYVNRMLTNNIDAYETIKKIANYFKRHKLKCLIMGASFKNTSQVIETFEAGADTVTISYQIMQQMLEKDLAIQAIEVFNKQGKELEMNLAF